MTVFRSSCSIPLPQICVSPDAGHAFTSSKHLGIREDVWIVEIHHACRILHPIREPSFYTLTNPLQVEEIVLWRTLLKRPSCLQRQTACCFLYAPVHLFGARLLLGQGQMRVIMPVSSTSTTHPKTYIVAGPIQSPQKSSHCYGVQASRNHA